jgi:hypothetical protein
MAENWKKKIIETPGQSRIRSLKFTVNNRSARHNPGNSMLHSGIFSWHQGIFNGFICHLLTLFRTHFWAV